MSYPTELIQMILIALLVVRLNALYERIRSDVYWYRWNQRRRGNIAAMRANLDAIKRDRQ